MKLTSSVSNKLYHIGIEVASTWGGECLNFSIDSKKKSVFFDCIECGERFYTELTFDELYEEYGIKL